MSESKKDCEARLRATGELTGHATLEDEGVVCEWCDNTGTIPLLDGSREYACPECRKKRSIRKHPLKRIRKVD